MKKKKEKGFTLVEITAALAMFMIVMLAITTILFSVMKYQSMNQRIFNANSMSKSVFEVIKEKRPTLISNPASFDGNYVMENIQSNVDVENFVNNKLFNTVSRPITISDPSDYENCKSYAGRYAIGLNVTWIKEGVNSKGKEVGYYKVETWCWDTSRGKSSEINRTTFVTPS